ncbi:MAG: NAD(P)/FAD-dependent oxidoreductase [Tepidiformaceae bacterium]
MKNVDVAVVGAGFGGLTAGALAAKSGAKVSLFEQHTRPGGCAGDFALEGFWFPAGATVVTGLEPGGILRQVFDKLSIDVPSRPLDPSITFHIPGHAPLPYVADVAEWKHLLRGALPGAQRYDRFWDWTHDVGGEVYRIGGHLPSLPLQRWADLRRTARATAPSMTRLIRWLGATVEDAKRHSDAEGSPAVDAMIDSLLMDATGAKARDCSAIQGAIALDLYRRGCQWVEGGTGRLAMMLARSIRDSGGEVRFGTGVRALTRTNGRWQITLADGEEVAARTVVANVPPAGLDRLLGRRIRPTSDRESWSAFVLHLGIDATNLPSISPFHQIVPSDRRPSSLVSVFESRKVGAPRCSISVSTHVRAADWRGFPGALACQRGKTEDVLLRNVEEVIPDVRDRTIVQRSATPQTFERFTSRPGGFVGGLIQRPNVVALRARGHRPEPALFLAGDHVFPGQGTVGTALSGINAYRDAIEALGGRPLL